MTDEATTEAVQTTSETMLGDLVSLVIDEMKAAPDVWQKLSQARQDDVIQRVTSRCVDLVREGFDCVVRVGAWTWCARPWPSSPPTAAR